jgi:hypothetical protein
VAIQGFFILRRFKMQKKEVKEGMKILFPNGNVGLVCKDECGLYLLFDFGNEEGIKALNYTDYQIIEE